MIPGETVYSGAPLVCPDCGQAPPGPQVMWSPAGHYIGYGGCDCGPAYSRESGYFRTHPSEYSRSAEYTGGSA